ncbi:RlmE family RNA methyltransferase [Algihabitans albus]|uniref:RlmE family RNA methyltransferase n=1 Tax=Algihabitans albus TaxID=2164067 RepID=UPI000E5C5916|nr:RlmE family RNA methyltransferase [Algihabitans albus]
MAGGQGKGGKGGRRGSASGGSLGGARQLRERVRTARGRRPSSTRWLERQLNDPYVAEARARGYRSRAAFKLLQLDEKVGLLKGARRIVDLGAAPGGWTQVAIQQLGPQVRVVAVDYLEMAPLVGATILQLDFLDEDAPEKIRAALDGPADLVLSDMAAPSTGHAKTDHIRVVGLAETALAFALEVLSPGGAFVAKVFQGGSERDLLDLLKQNFKTVRHVKPPASRAESSELYVVAQGFRGASQDAPDSD